MAGSTATQTGHRPEPFDLPSDPTGARMLVLGAVVALLAPLAGFLGGSMTGYAPVGEGIDPMVVWLTAGLVVGGIGAFVAFLGGLHWYRTWQRTART